MLQSKTYCSELIDWSIFEMIDLTKINFEEELSLEEIDIDLNVPYVNLLETENEKLQKQVQNLKLELTTVSKLNDQLLKELKESRERERIQKEKLSRTRLKLKTTRTQNETLNDIQKQMIMFMQNPYHNGPIMAIPILQEPRTKKKSLLGRMKINK